MYTSRKITEKLIIKGWISGGDYNFCGINEIFSREDRCYMTFFMNMILNMVANAAEGTAIFSVGTASLGGMYEPVMPDELKK